MCMAIIQTLKLKIAYKLSQGVEILQRHMSLNSPLNAGTNSVYWDSSQYTSNALSVLLTPTCKATQFQVPYNIT